MPISYRSTPTMAKIARKALVLRASMPKGNKAGTLVGLRRANQIANRTKISLDTIRRMHHFFIRNQRFQHMPEFSKGRQAWLLWVGMPAFNWSKRILRKEGLL